ncbi:MAG TPA: SUMF1/EgtB/PvdO family nonheme iron enzyme [Phycisphaerales bacterium]|nr:SUMF1/EgtB/PvdO family nonheme iron enzyme [Phycisphaerales bacterium]
MSVKCFISVAAFAAVTGVGASFASAQITIPTVLIGNPGNAADPATGNLYGAVAYEYRIGTTEVTNAQYAAFLNAKAASDPFNLYSAEMAESFGGIIRSGAPGSYTYSTVAGRANNPVNFVSFWDATRFANWLHNGQGNGSTETGAYTLGGATAPVNASVTRNAGWQWAVTSENEWYKAAYHQPASQGDDIDSYWRYPTRSNTVPTTAQANYNGANTRPVGSYAGNFYGTFDMGGNVFEWNEAIVGGERGNRGGAYNTVDTSELEADNRYDATASVFFSDFGFRVVQASSPTAVCDDIDVNNNTVFPEDQDVIDFFDVLAGGSPATCDPVQGCNDIDFNNNGVFPEDQDVIDFFNVLAGGSCP